MRFCYINTIVKNTANNRIFKFVFCENASILKIVNMEAA